MSGVPYPEHAVTVLLVCPHQEHFLSLQTIFSHSNWTLRRAANCVEALAALGQEQIPVIICERELPDGDWKTLLGELASLSPSPRIIVSNRLADDRLWAEVLNLGGYDLLLLPFDPSEVFRVTFLAWHSWKHECDRKSASPKPAISATSAGSPAKNALRAGQSA